MKIINLLLTRRQLYAHVGWPLIGEVMATIFKNIFHTIPSRNFKIKMD